MSLFKIPIYCLKEILLFFESNERGILQFVNPYFSKFNLNFGDQYKFHLDGIILNENQLNWYIMYFKTTLNDIHKLLKYKNAIIYNQKNIMKYLIQNNLFKIDIYRISNLYNLCVKHNRIEIGKYIINVDPYFNLTTRELENKLKLERDELLSEFRLRQFNTYPNIPIVYFFNVIYILLFLEEIELANKYVTYSQRYIHLDRILYNKMLATFIKYNKPKSVQYLKILNI